MAKAEMNTGSAAAKAADCVQGRLVGYASELAFENLPQDVIQAAKLRVIDTLGALIGGFSGEPCRITRAVAAANPNENGATVLGTRVKTSVELAALANATAARYLEYTDFYHWPGALDGHASDMLTPALAAAEHARATGKEFITAVVLGYEVFLRFCDVFPKGGFDYTNCGVLSSAIAAGKLFRLTPEQLGHAISMAVVPNVILKQVRRDGKTTFKPTATGHAGKAGVFAAILAQAGMEGPRLPFEGNFGFCDNVLGKRITLGPMGGEGAPFKVIESQIKIRPSERNTVPLILAAEKLAPVPRVDDISSVSIEIYKKAIDEVGTGEGIWNPQTREAAYHSIPYVVAAALTAGTVTLRSFDKDRLGDPRLRSVMAKTAITENEDFTRAFHGQPVQHRARITVLYNDGERLVTETGGLHEQRPDADERQIIIKFRSLTEEALGEKRAAALLDKLLHLEETGDVSVIPPAMLIEA